MERKRQKKNIVLARSREDIQANISNRHVLTRCKSVERWQNDRQVS